MLVTSTPLQMSSNEGSTLTAYVHNFNYQPQLIDFFKILPNFEQQVSSESQILSSFISKILNESKDLESEIVDMVNNNFGKLLLKI